MFILKELLRKMQRLNCHEVEVIWYDGGLQPAKPAGWPAGKDMNDNGGGVLFHGTKDTLICGCYGSKSLAAYQAVIPDVPKTERRVEKAMNRTRNGLGTRLQRES
ncbi:MAG: hypothetical protein MZV65_14055 [Chromatiales bacterium]|nr:hypothetical protein [Chromatiales bacterium]